MSPAFLASLTLGALVAWRCGVYSAWCRQQARFSDMAAEVADVPFRFEYAARVEREAFEERLALMTEGEILALAA